MKSVGIITTFRQPNWGSVLQAYALQKVIENMGYESELIDYIYPNEYHYGFGLKKFYIKPGFKRKIAQFLGIRPRPRIKMEVLNSFIRSHIKVSRAYPTRESLKEACRYDLFVSGSDQIWNPNTMFGDMSYFFDFASPYAKRVSYASSFACDSIPGNMKTLYTEALNKYQCISVRENNGVKLVKDLCGKEAKVVLDPTLLLNSKDWSVIAQEAHKLNLPDRYILIYMLGYTYSPDEGMLTLLNKVQKKLQIPVISLNRFPNGFKGETFSLGRNTEIGIPEFLYLIKNATIMVTSSFHGTAFSINFGTPFISLVDGTTSSDDRIVSLLKRLDLGYRCVSTTDLNITEQVYNNDVTKKLSRLLEELRQESLSFLEKALEG